MTGNPSKEELTVHGKALAVGAVALLALAAGCSSSGGSGSGSGSGTGTGSGSGSGGSGGKSITFVAGKTGDPFYITMKCGAQAEAAKLGEKFTATGSADWSVPEQVGSVSAVTATRPGGVLISPVDPNSLQGPIRTLQSGGTKVAIVDTTLTDSSIGVTRISSDNLQGGRQAADSMAQLTGGSGEVVLLTPDLTTTTTNARIQGFKQQLASKYPGLRIDDTRQVGDTAQGAAAAVGDELAAHLHLVGIFAANSQTGEGVGTGLKNAGRQGAVKVVSFDAGPQQVSELKSGAVDALISQDPYGIGQQAVDQLVNALTGKPVTGSIQTDLAGITRDNVGDPSMSRFLYRTDCDS
ncbi:ABC transporter substrate-binding protein [Kitasatospora sp. NBC_01287]|uniref:ABC transporter substrate-binding protein n=1 Tax=Kitasatospora sp. NBC_01287 TaxID=2903573 RepID=UPI0022568410|nr:ABC transporter substrate-binding protein [Kitasatospora sp. NBC_01287]MCX4750841.1 ABC transporter substrate-binding protein [Kitasatospora sp. NBC_01287]